MQGRDEPVSRTTRRRSGRRRGLRLSNTQWIMICAFSVVLLVSVVLALVSGARLADQQAARAEEQAAYDRRVYRTTVKYRSLIEQYAAEYGVRPAYLAAIILNESSYDPRAYVASTSARGLMQLIPSAKTYVRGTAFDGRNITDDDLYDPEINVCIGANYIRILSDRYGGDPVLVACAYHAGPNNVDYWLYRYSDDHKTLKYSEIPTQSTRDYARKVVDSYAIYCAHYYPDAAGNVAGSEPVYERSAGAGAGF